MSAVKPSDTRREWRASKREESIQLFINSVDAVDPQIVGARAGGFAIELNTVDVNAWIELEAIQKGAVAVVQVDPQSAASIKRFQKLASTVPTPLIATAFDPPLALVRSLLRGGARDVLPLPLKLEDLEAAIATLEPELSKRQQARPAKTGKLVSVIKSVGGVGATALLNQLAIRYAQKESAWGREACLIDLDVQFGDVAFQLGLKPDHSLLDLLEAGPRLDGDLFCATTTPHSSGLKIVAAPPEMMPVEGMPTDHLIRIVEVARREFATVFVDLPTNWTNWSLSLVAQSDLVLLVTELSVTAMYRAKRQLDLLASQDLNNLDVRVVANRSDKASLRMIRPADVRQALGRDLSFTIANDFALMRSAIDQGVAIGDLKRKSALGADLDKLDAGIAAALGLER